MRSLKLLGMVLLGLTFVACYGEEVKVQSTEIGYAITEDGLSKQEFQPGSHRLDYCWLGDACPAFLRLDVGIYTSEQEIDQVFLPESNVDLVKVKIAYTMRVKDDPDSRRVVLKEVKSVPAPDGNPAAKERIITQEAIANRYVDRIIPEAVFDTLIKYEVNDTLTKVADIGKVVQTQVNNSLREKNSPVEITELAFPDGIGDVPAEVIRAKRALYAVNEEKARRVKALEAEMVIEEKRQAFQRVRVANDRTNAEAAGISYDKYAALKTWERFADAHESFAATAEIFASGHTPFAFGAAVPAPPLEKYEVK